MPTTYSTLGNISVKFQQAADSTTGLGSYRMEDISDVNKTHNTNYPLLIIEPSTSTVENLNRGWERHTFTAYLLEPDGFKDNRVDVEHYDSTQKLFSKFLDYLMKTRTGAFGGVSVNKKGVRIERVKNLGNDKLMGVKVQFEVDMPSVLSEGSGSTSSLPTTNLHAHFKTTSGVTVGNSNLSWEAINNSSEFVEESNLSGDTAAYSIPAFSNVSNSWIFEGHSPHQSMMYPNFASGFPSTDNFSIFVLVKLKDDADTLSRCLFSSRATTANNESDDWFRLIYTNSGYTTGGRKSQLGVQVDSLDGVDGSNHVNMFKEEISPDIEFDKWMAIGFISDKTNQEGRIIVNNNPSFKINNYYDDYQNDIDQKDLFIGAFAIASFAYSASFSSMNGEMKDVIIYQDALNDKNAKRVNEYLMRRVLD
tara:strand:+ start:2213 stop:3475 length:1263 start_codon:yes stop_codon:yes gene_type:complete